MGDCALRLLHPGEGQTLRWIRGHWRECPHLRMWFNTLARPSGEAGWNKQRWTELDKVQMPERLWD